MTIEITKGSENPVAEFFSSPSNTPEIDEVEKYSGVTIKDSVTTCGDESSSVYIPVIFARQLERERNNARKDAAQLADRLSGLELRTTEELARMERERDEAKEQVKELIYIALRAISLAEIDFENDKFGIVSELRNGVERIKEGAE
jgi:hypothetical protein